MQPFAFSHSTTELSLSQVYTHKTRIHNDAHHFPTLTSLGGRAAAGWHLSSGIFMDCNDAKANSIVSAWNHRPFRGETRLRLAALHLLRLCATSSFLFPCLPPSPAAAVPVHSVLSPLKEDKKKCRTMTHWQSRACSSCVRALYLARHALWKFCGAPSAKEPIEKDTSENATTALLSISSCKWDSRTGNQWCGQCLSWNQAGLAWVFAKAALIWDALNVSLAYLITLLQLYVTWFLTHEERDIVYVWGAPL